jgi:hypothetical protein
MTYFTEQEQIGLRALAQELEEGKNTRGSVSRALVRNGTNSTKYPTELDLPSRLVAASDSQLIAAASQLGPWHGDIGFPSGIAVGGNADLVLYQNGAFNFSGHAHVSGAISYDFGFVWAVRDTQVPAAVYVFATNGRLHGTFEAGSRDHNWGRSEILPGLAAGWAALERGWSWHWEARVNADFGPFLDDIIRIVAAGQAIGNVIKFIA